MKSLLNIGILKHAYWKTFVINPKLLREFRGLRLPIKKNERTEIGQVLSSFLINTWWWQPYYSLIWFQYVHNHLFSCRLSFSLSLALFEIYVRIRISFPLLFLLSTVFHCVALSWGAFLLCLGLFFPCWIFFLSPFQAPFLYTFLL